MIFPKEVPETPDRISDYIERIYRLTEDENKWLVFGLMKTDYRYSKTTISYISMHKLTDLDKQLEDLKKHPIFGESSVKEIVSLANKIAIQNRVFYLITSKIIGNKLIYRAMFMPQDEKLVTTLQSFDNFKFIDY